MVERTIRPIPMGRRHGLFSWTEARAAQIGIIQRLIQTCKMHGINPTDYCIDALTPRLWKTKYGYNFFKLEVDRRGQ